MNFKEIKIKRSYTSCGKENIVDSFLNPVLKHTKIYKRSVGFFSSGVLESVLEGVTSLASNHGEIRLIASPQLNQDDVNAINDGYRRREDVITESANKDFIRELETLDDLKLNLLSDLIATGILDIKLAVTNNSGMYHDKLGVLEDFYGNRIAFYGSPNSSNNGYRDNYEKIRIVKSWYEGDNESVIDENEEFEKLWNNQNEFLKVYSYKESAKTNIIKVIEDRKKAKKSKLDIKLRDYQEEAIDNWVKNNYHGFFVMATGTGKTWTAIFAAKELVKEHDAMIVICAPYKHLVKQWAEDVERAFPERKIILAFSENQDWNSRLKKEIMNNKYNKGSQIIVISTIVSFKGDKFKDAIKHYKGDKLLIVDEAHRFANLDEKLQIEYEYMLGLSATPYSGQSAEKGNALMKFFGGEVFNLPIEDALERGFLVPYNYYPIFVNATEEEEGKFQFYTQKILGCFRNNVCIDKDNLIRYLRNRLRIISMSEEKMNRIEDIISKLDIDEHFVVYCGDGRLFDDEGNEIRHIQAMKAILSKLGFKSSQFTANENVKERMSLVDAFNKGNIDALAAIRCLDEGINIPSIKSALILSSNDDYREFVQRRGRILRLYDGKEYANIYDIIVLPSYESNGWAKIELRRFYEYAKLAQNWDELEAKLDDTLSCYDLTMEDIDVFDYEYEEETLDE